MGKQQISKDRPVYRMQDVSLPTAIIVDIDGTLAIMGERSPFNYGLVHLDEVNRPVADLIDVERKSSKHTRIIYLSGRSDECRDATRQWLDNNGLLSNEDELYMRAEGDYRKDSIIKKELFYENVQGRFRIKYVLDDRDQVVEMWRRELNLPCFQVYFGDF